MLGLFPRANEEASASSSSANESTHSADSSVLSQLEAMKQAQSEQAASMRLLESCISDMMGASRRSRDGSEHRTAESSISRSMSPIRPAGVSLSPAASFSVSESVAGRKKQHKAKLAESWTWSPEVQGNLEQSFEMIRSIRRRRKSIDIPQRQQHNFAASSMPARSKAPTDHARRCSNTPSPDAFRESHRCSCRSTLERSSSGSAAKERSSSFSASAIVARLAQAKSRNHLKSSLQDSALDFTKAMKRVVNSQKVPRSRSRVPARLANPSRTLRASWLFRQRVAGRLSKQDVRRQPCGVLCALTVCKRLPIASPDSLVGGIVDSLSALAVVHISTFTPVQVAFYSHFDAMPWHIANLFIELFFMLSIAFNFRRGFKHDGIHVSDPQFIALHYLRGEFFTDAIASFPCAHHALFCMNVPIALSPAATRS